MGIYKNVVVTNILVLLNIWGAQSLQPHAYPRMVKPAWTVILI